jgi:hypothetical protein
VTKTPHLFVYDYGTGGVWGYMAAQSVAEVALRYPRLKIVDEPPKWMDDDQLEQLRIERSYDIDQEPDDFLLSVMAEGR